MLLRFALATLCLCSCYGSPAWAADKVVTLRDDCPPGFELTVGHCELRSLYQMYDSLEGAGVGGLKTGLPAYRDGFTAKQIDLGPFLAVHFDAHRKSS